jgi:hypothetical protein
MKRLTFAVAGVIVATLSACTNSSSPSSAAGATAGAVGAASGSQTGRSAPPAAQAATPAVAPAACKQRYDTWRQGPGKGLVGTLSNVGSATVVADAQALTIALKKAQPALARAAQHPMPTCADPRGYWVALLMHVNAAAGSNGPASRTAAMKGVPAVTHALLAELKHTEEA